MVVVLSLLGRIMFAFMAWAFCRSLARGTVRTKGSIYERETQPFAYWTNLALLGLFLFLPLGVAVVATSTLLGF